MYSYVMVGPYGVYYPGLSGTTLEAGFYTYRNVNLFKDSIFLAVL